ncbi:MAG: LD-carboxypeptidase [Clostridia bacterium]|nr:LD-carboxypeptidase [Clostridia bacterium]
MKPKALRKGDTIGVIAQSEPITEETMIYIKKSVKLMTELGFKVKFSEHFYGNTTGYGETAKNKAKDINTMFLDKEVDAIFCGKGGFNCNSTFDYLDFEAIKNNPKIICGYSDPTSLINAIYAKTGLVTFHGPNLKTLSSEETSYGFEEMKKRFIEKDLKLGKEDDEYRVIKEGSAEGVLVRRKLVAFFKPYYR